MIHRVYSFKKLLFLTITYCLFINPLLSSTVTERNKTPLSIKNKDNSSISLNKKTIKSEYLLDTGDGLYIFFQGVNLFSRTYYIDSEGYLMLPELKLIKARGKTKEELEILLTKKYEEYILEPNISISVVVKRPVRFYLAGEVKNPGFYTFASNQGSVKEFSLPSSSTEKLMNNDLDNLMLLKDSSENYITPKIFDALQFGRGFSNYADISNIKVVRKNSISQGGGQIMTKINIAKMIQNGDQSENIRIFDGDTIIVGKSEKLLNEQLISINQSNLSPNNIIVYMGGNVKNPGAIMMEKGSSLIQTIYASGGEEYFTGKIRHVRFFRDGLSEQRYFNFDPKAAVNSYKNPIVMHGDIIQVNKNTSGKVTEVIKEVGTPILSLFTIFSIFD